MRAGYRHDRLLQGRLGTEYPASRVAGDDTCSYIIVVGDEASDVCCAEGGHCVGCFVRGAAAVDDRLGKSQTSDFLTGLTFSLCGSAVMRGSESVTMPSRVWPSSARWPTRSVWPARTPSGRAGA